MTGVRRFGPYFTKMALTYGFLVLVAVLFASITLSVFSGIYLKSEINESNTRLLKQVRIFFDYSVIQTVKGLIASRLLGGSEEASPLVLETRSLPPDGYTLYQLSKSLKTFSTYSPMIKTVLLYYPKVDTLITSEEGAFVNVSEQGVTIKNFPFYSWYERLRGQTASSGWITDPHLGYFQALPIFGEEEQKTVLLAVIIDVERVRNEIQRITDSPDIHVFVMNSGGIFFGTGNTISRFPSPGKDSYGFTVLRENNRKFGVSWVRSFEEDWIY